MQITDGQWPDQWFFLIPWNSSGVPGSRLHNPEARFAETNLDKTNGSPIIGAAFSTPTRNPFLQRNHRMNSALPAVADSHPVIVIMVAPIVHELEKTNL